MPRGLKGDLQIWTLARDLGLAVKDDPVAEILAHCARWASALLKEFNCNSLSELLEFAADRLGTVFREVRTDQELAEIKDYFLQRGEKEFALVDHELRSGVFAITFRLLTPRKGERQFISIIDCRDEKARRSYYSKWHELAHLLTLTDQRRLKFCRTHSALVKKDPEEALMEKIAGYIGYLPDLVHRHARGPISFDKIDAIRVTLCPESSVYASIIGMTKNWPNPCVLLEATLEYKKREREELNQPKFSFALTPQPKLRITSITPSAGAEDFASFLHPNMRVPKRSIIYRVFMEDLLLVEDVQENLSWWETSTDGYLPAKPYSVHARKQGDKVQALLIPTTEIN
jgi:hypothetical protein